MLARFFGLGQVSRKRNQAAGSIEGIDMARARNIKPGFFTNELLVELPFEHRLLFIGLWCLADKDGRLYDRPKKIKMEVFPADNVDVDEGLTLLHSYGFVNRYERDGEKCIQIVNWHKHQSPHHTEKQSLIKPPLINGEITVNPPNDLRGNPPDSGFTDSLIPDSPIPEVNPPIPPQPEKKQKAERKRSDVLSIDFERFWQAYPCHQARSKAIEAWNKLAPDQPTVAAILSSIEKWRMSEKWMRENGKYIPMPTTFLNQKRWLDEIEIDLPREYSADAIAVMADYTTATEKTAWPIVSMTPCSQDRAALIAEFIRITETAGNRQRYFGFLAKEIPGKPGYGFDWAIAPRTYLRAKEGNFSAMRESA